MPLPRRSSIARLVLALVLSPGSAMGASRLAWLTGCSLTALLYLSATGGCAPTLLPATATPTIVPATSSPSATSTARPTATATASPTATASSTATATASPTATTTATLGQSPHASGGRLLYLVLDSITGRHALVTAGSDGSHPVLLTDIKQGSVSGADWSPDGKKIAYSWAAGTPPSSNLYVMNADGSGKVALTKIDPTLAVVNLSWSPDGKQIAIDVVVNTGSYLGSDILVMDAEEQKVHVLRTSGVDSNPAWSPDGKRIAYLTFVNGQLEIHLMDVDGTHDTNLTPDPAAEAIDSPSSLAWSPDGQWLVFVSTRDGQPQIYKMRPDGSQQTRLTNNDAVNADPSWSPDGKTIVYATNGGLFAMNADGTGATAITNTYAVQPHFQP